MFAAHPIQTQAVTYIVQRAEILSSFFYLLALVLFIKARLRKVEAKVKIKIKSFSTSTLTLYSLSILSAVLAMGSKEIAMTLPAVILLYDFFFYPAAILKLSPEDGLYTFYFSDTSSLDIFLWACPLSHHLYQRMLFSFLLPQS